MNTPVLAIDPTTPEPKLIGQAVHMLAQGEAVVVPTDTVYGIAQLVTPEASPELLKRVKERPEEKNIPLLIASVKDLERYGSELPSYAFEMAAKHWPGALTLVVRASEEIPKSFTAEDGSVALRVPAHAIALALLEAAKTPLACSSANLSGKAPARTFDELDPLVALRVALVVDGGSLTGGIASTVVSCLGEKPVVLRPGPIVI
ncbi:MAG: L-threonylcarbamoyladenylate synthase [Coriobacteriia bacterium]|nr:L-threonylcarbamoyladenylate synthase [Coriobacteriia bacterium]